ncbi:LytTR family DNA-binding domain-containing protein [Cypionkella sp.]|uniref:LytTR family DNA-binding domain-containing protein n=1 Tax=Cypionkella sp. TaxID=2811411 RepID=UPI0026220F63|nr:LytTR family DNA-binding domain-containing protein [Cypionkella sp.]
MNLKFLTGISFAMNSNDLKRFFLSSELKIFAILCFFSLIWLNPYEGHGQIEPTKSVIIVALMVCAVFAAYFLIIFVAFLAKLRSLSCWMMTIPVAIMSACLGNWLTWKFGGPRQSMEQVQLLCVFHFILFCALEIVFAAIFLPRIRYIHPFGNRGDAKSGEIFPDNSGTLENAVSLIEPELRLLPEAFVDDEGPGSEAHVAGFTIKSKDIKYITANEHYISISIEGQPDIFVRSRLKDLVTQLPMSLGYSIHRSHWVAWSSISSVIKEDDRTLVVMEDLRRFSVARAKRADFSRAYQVYRNKSTSDPSS